MLPVGPLALKDISAQEVRQIINQTADDVTLTDGTSYLVSTGWDKWTGYGRVNAKRAVDRVGPTTMPRKRTSMRRIGTPSSMAL